MSEELYNSRDYCALAEELESLKKNYAKLEAQVVILKGMNFDFAGSLFKANARIAELEANIEILKDQQREARNILIDKKLQIDSLYEAGYKLQQRIAELEEKQRWIPVSERLPEANKCVLIYDAGGNMTVDILVKSGGVETYFWLPKYRILFWMPLPEPPEVKE